MELTLGTFNKGIANRIRPHLLPEGYSQQVLDADIVDGSLRPFRGMTKVSYDGPRLSYQNDAGTRSLEKWGDHWYWSDNDTGEIGSSIGYVGVSGPSTAAVAIPQVEGSLFKGDYRYLFTFETRHGYESSFIADSLEVEEGTLHVRASQDVKIIADAAEPFSRKGTGLGAVYYKHYGYPAGTIVEYKERQYQATHTFLAENVNGNHNRYQKLGDHQLPDAPLTGSEYWLDLGDKVSIEVVGYERILLRRIPQPQVGSAVAKINVYRTTSNGANYYLAESLSVGTVEYIDTVPDSALVNKRVLSPSYVLPPLYVETGSGLAKKGARYLTEQNATFYLAYENRVYLSEPGNPHSWNPNHYVELNDTVTALAREDRGVVAMTLNRTYHITGTTVSDIAARWIPNFQGCPNWRTVNYIHDVPVWLSNDGITVFGYEPNVNVERIQVLTETKHSFPDDVTHGAVANDIYYLFRPGGTAVCVDFRRELAIYERTLPSDFALADPDADRLLLRSRGQIYEINSGAPLTWTWRSAEMSLANRNVSTDEKKKIRSIYVNADSDFTLRVFADGQERLHVLEKLSARQSRRIYTRGIFCHHLTLEIECSGEVRHVSIEYFTTQKQR